jgi:hypothetical protein
VCDVSQDDWIDKGFDKQLAFQMAVLNRSHEQVQAEVQQASEDSRELDWQLMLATLMEAGQGMSDWEARKKVLLQENDLAFAHALQEHEWADVTTTTVGDDPSPGVSPQQLRRRRRHPRWRRPHRRQRPHHLRWHQLHHLRRHQLHHQSHHLRWHQLTS